LEITAANYNDVFNKFTEVVKDTINKHVPVKKLSRKERKFLQKPWFTKGIKISIKNKQRLYVSHFLNGNDFQKREYKKYSNKLTKVNFFAKKMFYENELKEAKQDTSKTWKVIKSLIPTNQNLKQLPTKLHVNNVIIDTLSQIATKLYCYFTKIGKELTEKVPPTNYNCLFYNIYLNQ